MSDREVKCFELLSKLKEVNDLYKSFKLDDEMIISFGKEDIEFINPEVFAKDE